MCKKLNNKNIELHVKFTTEIPHQMALLKAQNMNIHLLSCNDIIEITRNLNIVFILNLSPHNTRDFVYYSKGQNPYKISVYCFIILHYMAVMFYHTSQHSTRKNVSRLNHHYLFKMHD